MADAPELPPGSYDSIAPTVVGTVVLCLVVSTVAVGLRLYTRRFIMKQVGIDDYLAIVALLLVYGTGISVAALTKYGSGRHIWMVSPEDFLLYMRGFWVSVLIYCAALFVAKMMFLFQYYRGLAVPRLKPVFIAVMLLVGGWSLAQVLATIFSCNPINAAWDLTVKGSCPDPLRQFYINAAGNIITDIIVFLLPITILSRLNLVRAQKLALIGIFSLGFFTVAISVVRIKYLNLFEDVTWQNAAAGCWSVGELASGVTCACLPTLRPLVSGYFPQLNSDVDPADLTYDRHSRERKDLEASTSSSANRDREQHPHHGGFDGTALYDKFVPTPARARISRADPNDEEDSEEIMGLGSARQGQGLGSAASAAEAEGDWGTSRGSGGLSSPATARRPASNQSVSVQRDLVQSTSRRGGSLASGSAAGRSA